MKYPIKLLLVAMLGFLGVSAQALVITPSTGACDATDSVTPCLEGTTNETSNPLVIAAAEAATGETLTEVYKQDVGGPESGSFAGSYTTTFSNTATDPANALIEHVDGQPALDCITQTCYAIVKDGNQTPAAYFYNITGWNGTDDLSFEGFWPNMGAISHVALYTGEPITGTPGGTPGTPGGPGTVPEPGALSLLGLGLLGVGLARRRRSKAA